MSIFSIFQNSIIKTPAAQAKVPVVKNLFIPEEQRQEKTIYKVQPNGSLIPQKIKPQYSGRQDISTFTEQNPIEFESTFYNPDDKKQTNPTSTGKSPVSGQTLDWGNVARSNRGLPYGTKIYVPELKQTFTINDSKNIGYNTTGYFSFDFAIRKDNPRRAELESTIRNNPKMHFYIIK